MSRPDRSHLPPEQRASAEACDQLTDEIIDATRGMNIGVIVGACLNTLHYAADHLPPELRLTLAARMREAADQISGKVH